MKIKEIDKIIEFISSNYIYDAPCSDGGSVINVNIYHNTSMPNKFSFGIEYLQDMKKHLFILIISL